MRKNSINIKKLQETLLTEINFDRVDSTIPKPTFNLSERANKIYYGVAEALIKDKGYFERDHMVIEMFAKYYDLYLEIGGQIKNADDCIEIYTKGSNVSGIFTAFQRCTKQLTELMPQLGIGLKNRQNVLQYINDINENDKMADPWSERIKNKVVNI